MAAPEDLRRLGFKEAARLVLEPADLQIKVAAQTSGFPSLDDIAIDELGAGQRVVAALFQGCAAAVPEGTVVTVQGAKYTVVAGMERWAHLRHENDEEGMVMARNPHKLLLWIGLYDGDAGKGGQMRLFIDGVANKR